MGNSDQTLGAAFDVLLETVASRIGADPSESYTAQLLARGTAVAARKLGEEAVEAVIAACTGDREGLVGEVADVLFHLGVLLASAGIAPEAVAAELVRRRARSGLAEKASRPST